MLGAIIGNIVGSRYHSKKNQIKTKDFILFDDSCHFRIDSVCTAAVADILLNNRHPATTMQEWCRRYPHLSSGRFRQWIDSYSPLNSGRFRQWIDSQSPRPYNSHGNGAAMRVSPAAFLNRGELAAALFASDEVTKITHNHPEGMKSARATTHAIWLAYQGENVDNIRETIAAKYDYDLTQTVDEIRSWYAFNMTAQGTVPQAITCALESVNFEDAVRNAVSLGGDSDTLAAIAGPIAEALHGIPTNFKRQAESLYLADAPDILEVIRDMYRIFDGSDSRIVRRSIGGLMRCPNCDPNWRLVCISHRFIHRYAYGHCHNEYAPFPDTMRYRIVEPDPHRTGWIRVVEVDGTDRTLREMCYDSKSLDSDWHYHELSCDCKTVALPDLKAIPESLS